MRFAFLLLALGLSASAQNIILTDGTVVATRGVRRMGDTIMATVEVDAAKTDKPAPGDKPPRTGEIGYPLTKIAKVDFPEPPKYRAAMDLIGEGKAQAAIDQLEPLITFFESFREAPGSWWSRCLLAKAQALGELGRDEEASNTCAPILRVVRDPETLRAAETRIAYQTAQKGDFNKALGVAENTLKESKAPETLALASVIKGECLFGKEEWEDAMLAFLQVPVFYPTQKDLLPQVMLAQGRTFFAMENFKDATTVLTEVTKTYSDWPQAKIAAQELEKVARRQKALAPAK